MTSPQVFLREQPAADPSRMSLARIILPPGWLRSFGLDAGSALHEAAAVVWETPGRSESLVGIGTAAHVEGPRTSSLADAAPAVRALLRGVRTVGAGAPSPLRAFGGARFLPGGAIREPDWDAFGGWRFVVPRFLFARRDGELSGSFTALAEPGAEPAGLLRRAALDLENALSSPPLRASTAVRGVDGPSVWQPMIRSALEEITSGRYEKIVLARQVIHRSLSAGAVSSNALSRLSDRYRQCYVFKFSVGGYDWVGASPELLAGLEGGEVRAAVLAGSRPRGTDEAADRAFARELSESHKERAEHQFVTTAVCESLSPLCTELRVPDAPQVLKVPNIQHLYTPIEGRIRAAVDILDVLAHLHPTPAVGGFPRAESVEAISRLERLDRGWYAGPIGWVDSSGAGEFAVALRSALIGGGIARLFAGAGIVAESDPDQEFQETEMKLAPLRWALEGR